MIDEEEVTVVAAMVFGGGGGGGWWACNIERRCARACGRHKICVASLAAALTNVPPGGGRGATGLWARRASAAGSGKATAPL